MKILNIVILIGFQLVVFAKGGAASSSEEIASVYNQLIEIKHARDAQSAMRLIERLDKSDFWSMGGGVGPTDRVSLLITVCLAVREFLPWNSRPSETLASQSTLLQNWLQAEPTSIGAMLEMLGNRDPVPRWIALEKLVASEQTDSALFERIQQIAISDDYLCIQRKPGSRSGGIEHIFVAPLRDMAGEVLKKAGRTVPERDYDQLSLEGVKWLGNKYMKHREDAVARLSIEGALRQLTPKTQHIVRAQLGFGPSATASEAIALFERLAEVSTGDQEARDKLESLASTESHKRHASEGQARKKIGPSTKHEYLSPDKSYWSFHWGYWLLIMGLFAFAALVVRFLK